MTFRVGEETQRMRPGGTWRIGPEVPHRVEAGADGAVAFEIFSPSREDWNALEREPPRQPRWPPSP